MIYTNGNVSMDAVIIDRRRLDELRAEVERMRGSVDAWRAMCHESDCRGSLLTEQLAAANAEVERLRAERAAELQARGRYGFATAEQLAAANALLVRWMGMLEPNTVGGHRADLLRDTRAHLSGQPAAPTRTDDEELTEAERKHLELAGARRAIRIIFAQRKRIEALEHDHHEAVEARKFWEQQCGVQADKAEAAELQSAGRHTANLALCAELAAANALLDEAVAQRSCKKPDWVRRTRAHLAGQPVAPVCECSSEDLWECPVPGCPARKSTEPNKSA